MFHITIIYETNRSLRMVKRPEVSAVSTSETQANPVPVRATIHFVELEGSKSATSTKDQNNHVPSFTSDLNHQNTPIIYNAATSSQNYYHVPTTNRPLFRYRPWSFS
jgi:hypothetical protein